ncbi:nucleoside phosphorylase domain-containing protein [Stachybotrys elegans]|uniref:Nucleoside phosphorylase domain-containing protein n=1 Tax=Stachybotrys elegans TaxID=80388 RepID=A0A8K0WLF5_9HYPO|nr:nucleoside phosphorylase domain-containing protein [Stachybotrys elegans]
MSDPNDYTVGWICAIDTEYVAAQEFLDEEHPRLASQDPNDNNIYTLGRVGQHNVVIACLPHWNYGLVSAANVASDMLRTFTNVRFGLMVGVGGGVPTKQDIRLGDVVVSSLDYANGAVYQYDFGQTVQDKAFRATGHLDAPPLLLQAAVQDLKATYRRHGNQIDKAIAAVLERNPRLEEEYRRPDPITDRLYKNTFTHAGPSHQSCTSVCGDDESTLIIRDARQKYDDNPKVHYGLIASSNQLMKDALIRDRLAEEKGVLCFEMEAAGLMNHFKCLVIRGICDYSDSHKNDVWKGYAAMAAAAYAKDLLGRITPTKVAAERKLSELLANGQSN